LSYLLLAGLNIHTPHHFFPTADHAVLPKILIIVDEVCKERGIKHSVQNRMSCFKSLSRGITHRIPFTAK
jgi:fatty acid desaturase